MMGMFNMRRREGQVQVLVALALFCFGAWMFSGPGADAVAGVAIRFGVSDRWFVGEVTRVVREAERIDEREFPFEHVTVHLLTGAMRGEDIEIRDRNLLTGANEHHGLVVGERIIVSRNLEWEGEPYYITDRFRLPALLGTLFFFLAATIFFGGWRGFTSLVGLACTALILLWFIVPRIVAGHDAVWTSILGAALIAVVSLFVAHGLNRRTVVALLGTLSALAAAAGLSAFFVSAAKLVGLGTEQSFLLRIGQGIDLDLQGVLLGAIILGTLGVLDDITVGQTAVVAELAETDPKLDWRELFRRGLSVGREHIASLVNTLFLAYAGVALPLLIYLAVYQREFPVWFVVNGEELAEEIVRTLAGSIALILAVPLTTALAAWRFGRRVQVVAKDLHL